MTQTVARAGARRYKQGIVGLAGALGRGVHKRQAVARRREQQRAGAMYDHASFDDVGADSDDDDGEGLASSSLSPSRAVGGAGGAGAGGLAPSSAAAASGAENDRKPGTFNFSLLQVGGAREGAQEGTHVVEHTCVGGTHVCGEHTC